MAELVPGSSITSIVGTGGLTTGIVIAGVAPMLTGGVLPGLTDPGLSLAGSGSVLRFSASAARC